MYVRQPITLHDVTEGEHTSLTYIYILQSFHLSNNVKGLEVKHIYPLMARNLGKISFVVLL